MNTNDIIVHTCSDRSSIEAISKKSLEYALISVPFTINRMGLKNLKSRILNIYKGKLAEALMNDFAIHNNLNFDFNAGETPFWQGDNFDFQFRKIEWDLKNNFTLNTNRIDLEDYLHLPALIPHRFEGDQWTKAHDSESKGFVFSFMNQNRTPDLKDLVLNSAHFEFLEKIVIEYPKPEEEPFEWQLFFDELKSKGTFGFRKNLKEMELVITAYADHKEFEKFQDTDGIENFNYSMYTGKWYKLDNKARLVFRNGLLRTRIKNATCPIAGLPAFSSLI